MSSFCGWLAGKLRGKSQALLPSLFYHLLMAIGVLFGCFASLVYLVVQSSTRAIYFPKRTPMLMALLIVSQLVEAADQVRWLDVAA